MRMKSLAIFFNWLVCGMGLFGMSQYIGQVGGNIFVNVAVSGLTQIPGNFVAWWAMNKLGRKITLIISNITAGISALLLITTPQSKLNYNIQLIKNSPTFHSYYLFVYLLIYLFQMPNG